MALLNLQLCIRRRRQLHSPPLVRLTPVTAVAVFTAAFVPLAAITAITATTFVRRRRHLIIDGLRCHATSVDSRSMLPLSFVRVIVCFARVSQIRSSSAVSMPFLRRYGCYLWTVLFIISLLALHTNTHRIPPHKPLTVRIQYYNQNENENRMHVQPLQYQCKLSQLWSYLRRKRFHGSYRLRSR